MRRFPPREEPPERRFRRDLPRPEGPFDRLLRRRPERDPAPIIIGGTIAFLALVIVMVFVFSSLLGDGGGGNGDDDAVDIAPGIRGRLARIPALPPGLVALSEYVEFEIDDDVPAIIGLPLREKVDEPAGLGFYTFFDGRWQRLAEVTLRDEGSVGEGEFSTLPKNLAVLKVVAQTYQVAGSLPPGAKLHTDARVNILSPRDYSPAADGSVQGKATNVSAEAVLLIPTIVASGEDTAAVVNDILADETLRAQHIEAIASLVEEADLDGVDLEYSSVDVDLASEFTQFVTALSDSLHRKSKRLSLTLPPPSNQRQAYEWEKLGEAVDIIRILPIADALAYWETMPGSLSEVVEQVEPGKVMLVLSPFSTEGIGDVTRPLGYLQAMVLAAEAVVREPQNPDDLKPGAAVKLVAKNLDEGEGASPLRWSDEAAAVSFALGGTERRRIFIENSFSAGFKLELVQAYGLGGVAIADASAQSDVANLWPLVNELVRSATVTLRRPNDSALLPAWQAPDGGDLGAATGTSATWIAPDAGTYNIILVVSDGERRFGRKTLVEVKKGTEASPSPLVTFGLETPTATGSPTPTGTPAEEARVLVEVGMRADGDDADSEFSNNERTSPGSTVTYRVLIDNDSNSAVTVESLEDSEYGSIECDGGDVIGQSLASDDGDGVGEFDGGADEIVCTFTATAPDDSGETVQNVITVVVEDREGRSDSDQDDASFTTT